MLFSYDPAVALWYPASSAGNTVSGPFTVIGSGPGAFSLPYGTGSLGYTLPPNSVGWHAPTSSGGPSYLFTPPANWTSGFLYAAAPATGTDGSNQAVITPYHMEGIIPANTTASGLLPGAAPVGSMTMLNAGKIIGLTVQNAYGTCTTPPYFNVCVNTTCGVAVQASSTAQALGTVTPQSESLNFAAGAVVTLEVSTAGSGCPGASEITASATYQEPAN
jgi:hypothetical protein